MELKCLLDLLVQKQYINIRIKSRIKKNPAEFPIPDEYRINKKDILTKANFDKIKQLLINTKEIIVLNDWENSMIFVKITDLEKFCEKIKNSGKEEVRITTVNYSNYLDDEEIKWIEDNTNLIIEYINYGNKLINPEIREKRLEIENKKNKEAEQLLNALLK